MSEQHLEDMNMSSNSVLSANESLDAEPDAILNKYNDSQINLEREQYHEELDAKPPPPPITKVSFKATRNLSQSSVRGSSIADYETKHGSKRLKVSESNSESARRLPTGFSSSSSNSDDENDGSENAKDKDAKNERSVSDINEKTVSPNSELKRNSRNDSGDNIFKEYIECIGSWPDPKLGDQYLWTDVLCMRIRADTGCKVKRKNVGDKPLTEVTGIELIAPSKKCLEEGIRLIEEVQKGVKLAGKTRNSFEGSNKRYENEAYSKNADKRRSLKEELYSNRHMNKQRSYSRSFSRSNSRYRSQTRSKSFSRSGSYSSRSDRYSQGSDQKQSKNNMVYREKNIKNELSRPDAVWPPPHPDELPPPPQEGEEDEHGNMWRAIPDCSWVLRGTLLSELCEQGKAILLQPFGIHVNRKGTVYVIGESTRVKVVAQVVQAVQAKQPKKDELQWLLDQINAVQRSTGAPARPVPPPPNPPGKIFKRSFYVREFIGLLLRTQLRWVLDIMPKITGVRSIRVDGEVYLYKNVQLSMIQLEGANNHIAASVDMLTMIMDCYVDINEFERKHDPQLRRPRQPFHRFNQTNNSRFDNNNNSFYRKGNSWR